MVGSSSPGCTTSLVYPVTNRRLGASALRLLTFSFPFFTGPYPRSRRNITVKCNNSMHLCTLVFKFSHGLFSLMVLGKNHRTCNRLFSVLTCTSQVMDIKALNTIRSITKNGTNNYGVYILYNIFIYGYMKKMFSNDLFDFWLIYHWAWFLVH